ncbi:MAG: hypothetical protein U0359_37435 [Byssovorax sp.]
MSLEALRAIERAHGALGWLSALAAVIAAFIAIRRPARGQSMRLAAAASGMLLAAFASGLALDEGYRARLRQKLFLASATLGWLFERKLHLAFGAVLLAAAGLCSTLGARRSEGSAQAAALDRAARVALGGAALLALFAAIASAAAARRISF